MTCSPQQLRGLLSLALYLPADILRHLDMLLPYFNSAVISSAFPRLTFTALGVSALLAVLWLPSPLNAQSNAPDSSEPKASMSSSSSSNDSITAPNPEYRVPKTAPLYKSNSPYDGSELIFPSHFALGAGVAMGRLESPGKKRGAGPARTLHAEGTYQIELPSMNHALVGIEYATSSLNFSTGRVDVPVTFSVKSSYGIKVYNQLSTRFTLALGRSYGKYFENRDGDDVRSDGLISGTALRLGTSFSFTAYKFVALNTGFGYSIYEFYLGKILKGEKSSGQSRTTHLNERLVLQVPYLLIGVSAHL